MIMAHLAFNLVSVATALQSKTETLFTNAVVINAAQRLLKYLATNSFSSSCMWVLEQLILWPDALPDANPLLFPDLGPAQWCAGLHTPWQSYPKMANISFLVLFATNRTLNLIRLMTTIGHK